MKYIGQKKKLEADLLTPEGQARWPAVILIAGWQGDGIRNERSRQISEILLSAGFAVLTLNLPGHGKSWGEKTSFTLTQGRDAILTTVSWLKKQKQIDGSRVSVIATSIGGSVAILAAAKYGNFRSLVLLSPRTDFRNTGWETYRLRNSDDINRAIRRSGLALDFYRLAKKIKVPALIIHGRADEFIPVEQSEKLLKSLASETKKLKLLNAGHQYSPKMFRQSNRQAAEFVIKHP